VGIGYARNEALKAPSERRRLKDRGTFGAERGGVFAEGVSPPSGRGCPLPSRLEGLGSGACGGAPATRAF